MNFLVVKVREYAGLGSDGIKAKDSPFKSFWSFINGTVHPPFIKPAPGQQDFFQGIKDIILCISLLYNRKTFWYGEWKQVRPKNFARISININSFKSNFHFFNSIKKY